MVPMSFARNELTLLLCYLDKVQESGWVMTVTEEVNLMKDCFLIDQKLYKHYALNVHA